MPTQEERLLALEQMQTKFGESISDLNHYVTIMTGIMSREEWDIREIKTNLRSIDGRLSSFEQAVNSRFDTLEGRFDTLEGRFGTLEGRFGTLEGRFGAQEKKLDQVLLLLNTSISKPE